MFVAMAGLVLAPTADGAARLDRWYQLGDHADEVPLISGEGDTIDSLVVPGGTLDGQNYVATDFHDMLAGPDSATGPTYFNVGTGGSAPRPFVTAATSWGVNFDGTSDHLFINGSFAPIGGGLGVPNFADGDPAYGGSVNWNGIDDKVIEFWVRPTAASVEDQFILADTNNYRIFINESDDEDVEEQSAWGFVQGEGGGATTNTEVPVEFGEWAHVMYRSFGGGNAVLYINGVGIDIEGNDRDISVDNVPAELSQVVGANFDKTTGFFTGQIDNVRMYIAGDNSKTGAAGGMNWGSVDMAVDNEFIKETLAAEGNVLGDVDIDGDSDPTDLAIFLANWGTTQDINGFVFGDLVSRQNGDFDFDGDIDLDDALTLRDGLLAGSGVVFDLSTLGSVPEPASVVLLLSAFATVLGWRRRRS
jgi:hypothetical protein